VRTLWGHQEGLRQFAEPNPNVLALMDVGTGKTGGAIRILCDDYMKAGDVLNTLILAPLSVCSKWKREFALFSTVPEDRILVLTGDCKKRAAVLAQQAKSNRGLIVVTNYQGLLNEHFHAALLKFSPICFVADELHRLKDAGSKTHKAARPLAHAAERRLGLTGTPLPNGLEDIYGQVATIAPHLMPYNFFKFQRLFFYNKNANAPSHVTWPEWAPKPGAAEQIAAIIAPVTFQVKKEECMTLPPLVEETIAVELSPAQRKAYKEMEKAFVAELETAVSIAEFASTKSIRLRQMLAGFAVPHATEPDQNLDPIWFKENPRLDALEDLLDSLKGRKVIIWTVFQPAYKRIAEVCEKMGRSVDFIVGQLPDGKQQTQKQRDAVIEAFEHGSLDTVIANAAAGGEGIDLIAAAEAIYYDRSYNSTHMAQTQGRNYRGGSERHEKITHFHLVAGGTLDEEITTALLEKKDLADAVMNWARAKRGELRA
jgi:SNF2 family DNA or RNA helicase